MAQFTNQAQLSYNGAVTNSNVAVGEILEVLSATKTAVRDQYGQNDNITYVVSVVNSGTSAFNNLTVTDDLGAYTAAGASRVPLDYVDGSVLYYVNGALQAAPTVSDAGGSLVISGISVPAGGNATIVYETATNSFAPLGTGETITNQVTVTGGNITPITATATVTAQSAPVLSIAKSISPVPVTESGTLTYTFVIQNSGNTAATAEDLVQITDTFNPILSNLTVTFDGAAWEEGTNYQYDDATGLFTTVAGQITVPAATFAQDAATGQYVVTPGVSTLVVSGTV